MRIAVFASWRPGDQKDWRLQDSGGFPQAAEALGRRIVERGHSLVVGTDGEDTADYLAARGAAAALGQQALRRVHILAPHGKGAFTRLRTDHPRFFTEQSIPADDWAPAKV